MMTQEQVVLALQDRNLKTVSAGCGLAYNTVYRVATGLSTDPAYDTIKALSDYLERKAAETLASGGGS